MDAPQTAFELPRPSPLTGGGLALVGGLLFALGLIVYLWDQSRAIPSGDINKASEVIGTINALTPSTDKTKPGYVLTILENTQIPQKYTFGVTRYVAGTLQNVIVPGGTAIVNQVRAFYNPQTKALYSLKLILPQRTDPIYNTDQDVFGNVPFVIALWVVAVLVLGYGLFSAARVLLDRIAAPVTVIATKEARREDAEAIELRLTPVTDIFNRGKPFRVYVSPYQYGPARRASTVAVRLSPALRHVYDIHEYHGGE